MLTMRGIFLQVERRALPWKLSGLCRRRRANPGLAASIRHDKYWYYCGSTVGTTTSSTSTRYPLADFRYLTHRDLSSAAATESSTPIVSSFVPFLNDDDYICFGKPERISREDFGKQLEVFREYKNNGIVMFDRDVKMWKMEATALEEDDTLASRMRQSFLEAGFFLEAFPNEELDLNDKDDGSEDSEYRQIVRRLLLSRETRAVAITKEEDAFFILTPTCRQASSYFFDDDVRAADDLIENGLSGPTHRIQRSFPQLEWQLATNPWVYVTYDVWLVAEFLEAMAQKSPETKLAVSTLAQKALSERFNEKDMRRQPIPQVEEVRSSSVPLHPHQAEGVRFFQDNNGCGLLGDEMGLGKTLTTLAFIAATRKRALVVTPLKVVGHWVNEARTSFRSYFDGERALILGKHLKPDQKEGLQAALAEAHLVCVNYEVLDRFLPLITLKDYGLDTIVLDESHYIKNPNAKRTQLLMDVKDYFPFRILLSGTPIKNRVREFITQMAFLGMKDAGKVEEMSQGELWNKLQEENLYLRRTMKKELPHLQFSDPELVDVHDAPDAIKGFQSGLVEKVVDSKGNEMIGEMVRRSLMEVALFKAPKTATFANEIVDKFPGDKIIILTERIACAELMFSALSGMLAKGAVVLHHGRLSDAERKAAIDSFSESSDGGPQILVSTRPSVGVGINLQCANRVIFNDLPWTPADILQASARVKRLNQPKEVFEYWLLSDTVFDTNLMKILMKKLTLIRQYAEGQNISEEDQKWMHQRVTLEDIFYGMDKGKDISGEIMGKG